MIHLWHQYWAWTGGNVGAMPLQALITVAATLLLRRPLAAYWHKHFGAKADLAEIRKIAEDGRKIAADLHKHVTGHAHQLAPDDPGKRG